MISEQQQQQAQLNIGKADAVHDLGQSGRVRSEDLPLCRLALGDMLKDIKTPSVNTTDGINHMNEGLSSITAGVVENTAGGSESSYERHYAKSIFPLGYQTISFQEILKGYFDWEEADKPGERPWGWLTYTGFRSQKSKDSDTPKLWEKQKKDARDIPVGAIQLVEARTSNYGSLEISYDNTPGKYEYKKYNIYDKRNKRIICDFIIKYLYPGRKTIDHNDKGVFVFDANPGSIKVLFEPLHQISSEINPMVLADSAGTSMSNLGEKGSVRNAFCFPINNANTFKTSANIHTGRFGPDERFSTEFFFIKKTNDSGSSLQYTQETYNMFDFRIVINFTNAQGQTINKIWDVPFSDSGPSSGPSVAYLGKVIAAIRTAYYANSDNTLNMINSFAVSEPKPSMTSIMNITVQIIEMMRFLNEKMTTAHICLFIERLAMDVKKCGDWEQIQSVKTSMNTCPTEIGTAMLCTGDYLCAAKARLEGVNGVWHNEGQGGETAWKLQLFRSPDLTDPTMTESINIVNNARLVLPLLHLASKTGVLNIGQRLIELKDKTAYAVQVLKQNIDVSLQNVGQEAIMVAYPTMFPDIFSSICLANVSYRASKIIAILQDLVNLRKTLEQLNIQDVINNAESAITNFQKANSTRKLPEYITKYSTDINTWKTINDNYAFLQPAIIGVLIDLKFPVNIVNSLTTSQGDVSEDYIRDKICSQDATVLVESDQVKGKLIVNPDFICGKSFHYDYKSMIEVSAKQSVIHMRIEQINNLMGRLKTTMDNLATDAAMKEDYSFARNQIGTDFNAVIAILLGYMEDTANNKYYKKFVASTTNFLDNDIANIAKNALLISIKVPKKLANRWSHDISGIKAIHQALCETVDLFKKLASYTTNMLLNQVLYKFYGKLGFDGFAGGSQAGGLKGPTNIAVPNNVDLREQQGGGVDQALTTYFDSVISTVIGYCRNVTSQITDTNLSAIQYIEKLRSFGQKNISAFELARAALIKGLLVGPDKKLVYGPQTINYETLKRMFSTKIITQLMFEFKIVDNNNIPIFNLPALDPTTQNDMWNIVTNDSLENLARSPYLPARPDDYAILNTLIYATLIGDIWGSSLQDTFKNAYDNLYISNVDPSLPHTETVFNANPIRYNELMTLPYVARCVTEQILIFPPQAGETIETCKYSSVQFLKSPLTEIIFEKGPIARWASMGRFDLWSELKKDDDSMEDDDIDTAKFAVDVLDYLYNASSAVLNNNLDDIDTAKLAFGIANLPKSYYGSDNSFFSSEILTRAQFECDYFLAQSYQAAEIATAGYGQQLIDSDVNKIVQYNREILQEYVVLASAFHRGGYLSNFLDNAKNKATELINMRHDKYSENVMNIINNRLNYVAQAVRGGRKRTKKRKQRPRKTRRRKTRARTARGKIIKKKSTRRNKKRPIKTRSKH
tara:strand:+ start:3241 stop:7500 length:4260 start_codon:yes stop_codon:yes gene_type:complete